MYLFGVPTLADYSSYKLVVLYGCGISGHGYYELGIICGQSVTKTRLKFQEET